MAQLIQGQTPPLDLLDARKLSGMVAVQSEEFLSKILKTKGYSEEQIEQILVNKPFVDRRFKR